MPVAPGAEVFCFFFSKKKFFAGAIWKAREVGDGLRFP
jgi:hypothetical protein